MYNLKLSKGQLIDVYRDYKNKIKYEGKAKLIEKVDVGDTFYEDWEKLYVEHDVNSDLVEDLCEEQVSNNEIYNRIEFLFAKDVVAIRALKNKLITKCSRLRASYNNMYKVVESYRTRYKDKRRHPIQEVFKIDNKHLIRYIQQTTIKNWSETVFRSEKWIVRFDEQTHPDDPDKILFNSSFQTSRKIRVLVKISPRDITKYTSYNGRMVLNKYIRDLIKDSQESNLDIAEPSSKDIQQAIEELNITDISPIIPLQASDETFVLITDE